MGRNAAGESFLRGFLQYAKGNDFWFHLDRPDWAGDINRQLAQIGRNAKVHVVDKRNLGLLAEPACIFFPGPGLAEFAWQRAAFGHESWSLCGITHTTSSARAMDAIVGWIEAPVQPWDAVICTSTAVKANVEILLQAQVDHLKWRLGITKIVLPQLPVIPLGIHVDDFAFEPHQRLASREQLGLSPDDIVVLFMGRLSFHAKAHPLPMYLALERAWVRVKGEHQGCSASKARLVLIECGWHANEHIAKAFSEAAALAAPSVRVISLDGRDALSRLKAWSSADVFCSLSDNVQETFGITPIEAMASGLPVVVSDWDGYRDSVRDKQDGFRISTRMPRAGLGADLALRHALEIDNYDMYCGHSASFVSVDIDEATEAFVHLFSSKVLRQTMGNAARNRAKSQFDWSVVMGQYEALWTWLKELRLTANPQPRIWPARIDPMQSFAAYPTFAVKEDTLVYLAVENAQEQLERFLSLAMVNYATNALPRATDIQAMLSALAQSDGEGVQAMAIAMVLGSQRAAYGLRTLVWLAKLGIVRFGDSRTPEANQSQIPDRSHP